jgi:hypothetical protein
VLARENSVAAASCFLSLCAVRSSWWPDFYRLWQSPSRSTTVAETTGFVGAAIAVSRSISQRNPEASGERHAKNSAFVAAGDGKEPDEWGPSGGDTS